jgi:cell wall assembly regulator SMI1
MITIDDVVSLFPRLEKPPGETIPSGLLKDDLDRFEQRTEIELPSSFRSWLMTTNGPCVGPGGIVGIGTTRDLQDLECIYDLYPTWKEKGWIPIAGDGCGNYYVLTHGEYNIEPVVFVDVMENSDEPAFVVASSLWQFLDFLFRKDLGKSRWPFDEAEVVATDPNIIRTQFVLPWNA